MAARELLAELVRIAGGGEYHEYQVISERRGALVVRVGDRVVKAHPPGTGADELSVRVRVAADPALRGVLLPPVGVAGRLVGTAAAGDRLVTAWPAGEPVDPDDPAAAPWAAAGGLLAALHAVAPDAVRAAGPLPPAGGPARVRRALDRLTSGSAEAGTVRGAYRTLPAWVRGEATPRADRDRALVHGDWHLGQLVRRESTWVLVDVDDLGLGEPAWDLARPAAWFAAGVLPAQDWAQFLDSYRAAGGWMAPDPWPELEVPARSLVVQSAALAVSAAERDHRPLDDDEQAMVDACARILRTVPNG